MRTKGKILTQQLSSTKLNFGCGKKIEPEKEWLNVDNQSGKGINKSFNFNSFPYPFKDNAFEEIRAWYILEHLDDVEKVMDELWRISKNKAKIDIIIPYYNSQSAVNCIQHKHLFSDTTIRNLLGINNPYRVNNLIKFKLTSMELITSKFWTWIPQSCRASIGKYIPNVVNTIHCEVEVIK